MSKYSNLIHTFEKQQNFWGDFMPPYQAYFRGHDCMPESSFYSSYRCYMKEAYVDRWPNFHTEDEYLCFIGYDMADPWDSFDAEIEFWIGNDIKNMEQYIFTEPTIVRIPPYTWHCPLEYLRVSKPIYMQVIHPRGKFGAFFQRTDENGEPYIEYSGSNGHRQCSFDKSKQCTYCGKCWKPDEDGPKTASETMALINAMK